QSKGYVVRLIAPQFVKPYVKSNKSDANDAQAVCEAMSRPSMRFVAVKTAEQQDIQAVHRVESTVLVRCIRPEATKQAPRVIVKECPPLPGIQKRGLLELGSKAAYGLDRGKGPIAPVQQMIRFGNRLQC